MRKLKRKVLMALLAGITALPFTACGGNGSDTETSSLEQKEPQETGDVEITQEPSEEPIETPEETQAEVLTDEPVNEAVDENVEDTSGDTDKDVLFDFSSPDTPFGEQNIDGLKIKHGDLLSVIFNDGIVIVKAKIEPSLTNQMTVDQNYFNVADLVKKHGFNTCNELQYWAVADMSNGDESKCISFTLDKTTIDGLYNDNIIENQLGDYTTDLWILPSLQD